MENGHEVCDVQPGTSARRSNSDVEDEEGCRYDPTIMSLLRSVKNCGICYSSEILYVWRWDSTWYLLRAHRCQLILGSTYLGLSIHT
jgi:hypothetical protein